MTIDQKLLQEEPIEGVTSGYSRFDRNVEHVKEIVLDVQNRQYDSVLEKLFHIKRRGTTWQMEVICGLIQFISCVYVLPVVPLQLESAGFDVKQTVIVTVRLLIVHLNNLMLSEGCSVWYWMFNIRNICKSTIHCCSANCCFHFLFGVHPTK
jgi:hypothetical protein